MPPRSELLLLALAGGLLLLGGGIGCEPTLAGVDFKAKSLKPAAPGPLDWFMAFGGKKPPGSGEMRLPYTLRPPFGVRARMGVFEQRALAPSVGAQGCVGLRDAASSDEHRLCLAYGTTGVEITFGGESVDCPGVRRAELELAVDAGGTQVVASYRCFPIGPFSTLDTAPSQWADGEPWNAFVAAAGLGKGAQMGFDNFFVDSHAVIFPDPGEPAFLTFDALRLGIEAVLEVEDDNPGAVANLASEAQAKLENVAATTDDPAQAKRLDKAAASFAKLAASGAKYPKGFTKLAAVIAAALEALEER
jgi:hypothetical protein